MTIRDASSLKTAATAGSATAGIGAAGRCAAGRGAAGRGQESVSAVFGSLRAGIGLTEGDRGGRELSIHGLFENRAGLIPDRVALVHGSAWITYEGLNRHANRIAHFLNGYELGPGSLVALCLDRGIDLVAAMLGVLKAGAAYVPLDPAYPKERIAFALEDSRAGCMITRRGFAPSAADTEAAVIYLEEAAGHLLQQPEEDPRVFSAGACLAYVLFTSGSTGRPKGVAISHGNVTALLEWAASEFSAAEIAGMLAATSVCFDLSVFEIFLPLVGGGSVNLAEDAFALPGIARPVTLVNTVPSAAMELLRLDGFPETVRTVNLAGEPLRRDLVSRLYRLPHVKKVYNLYGPSEDTTYSTFTLVPADSNEEPTIGLPISGTGAHLADAALEDVAPGQQGELLLAGSGVARGYLYRPDLTAERFVPNPFGETPGTRLYKTGDLARSAISGDLHFLGRLDHQVKIRGFRIELGEVEHALCRHPGVSEAAVLVRTPPEDRSDKQLVAFVEAKGAGDTGAEVTAPGLDAEDLRGFLAENLPHYMVPAFFEMMPSLPRTPNGKIDRTALAKRTRELEPPRTAAVYHAPRNALEARLAMVWADALGLPKIGIDDDFFALGGDSIIAMRIFAEARRAGLALDTAQIFQSRTIAGLATLVSQCDSERSASIEPVTGEARNLLAPTQLRLWFMYRLDPKSHAYNMPYAVRLRGRLDRSALWAAFRALLLRHEVLRSRFGSGKRAPRVVFHPEPEAVGPLIDLGGLARNKREDLASALSRKAAVLPFDLEREQPVRAHHFDLGGGQHLLLVNTHHIVNDGLSLRILFRELKTLYAALVLHLPSPLAPLPFQYADYASWHRRQLDGGSHRAQLAYWRDHLAGAPAVIELPLDFPRPPVQTFDCGVCRFQVPAAAIEEGERLARERSATLFMLLMTVYAETLSRYSGQETVCIGTPVATRSEEGLDELIGFFVNTLVMRCDLHGDPVFEEALARFRRTALDGFANKDVPFDRIVEHLAPERDLSRTPLFQVILTLENMDILGLRETAQPPGLTLVQENLDETAALFDLSLHLRQDERGLAGQVCYNANLYRRETAEAFAGHFVRLLEGFVNRPGARTSEVDMLAPEERRLILETWNRTATDYPADQCLHRLFEAQAAQRPDETALVYGDRELGYGDLNQAANRLAETLESHGIGPESRVGLCLETSFSLVAAVLAILKRGGAYVPISADYPSDRIRWIAEDAGLSAVIGGPDNPTLASLGLPHLVLGKEPEAGPHRPNPGGFASPNLCAYVMYTSGSTGRPKGVAVTHRNVVRLVKSTDYVDFGPEEILLQASSISFDAATFEIWGSLLHGARLVLIPFGATDRLAEILPHHGITCLWLTAQLFNLMVDEHIEAFATVRQVLAGGEALSVPHVRKFRERYPQHRLVNGYGPTECTTFTCCADLRHIHPTPFAVPIGRPIKNTTVTVLDRALRPVPVGVFGQLFVGGDGLARGYHRRPDLTAWAFMPNPHSSAEGGRMYRTGDMVRYLSDGTVEFGGRADRQIKLRGFRIELGEIETILRGHPDVADAAVLARTMKGRSPMGGSPDTLVAYVLTAPGSESGGAALRGYLGKRLPVFMVPTFFVFPDAFPVTSNGKLDRKALARLPIAELTVEDQDAVAPRTEEERTLAAIWRELLGVPSVGVHHNFFELGGHSLIAVQLVSRVSESFGVDLGLRAVFDYPVLESQARIVAESRQQTGAVRKKPIEPAPAGSRNLLSPMQTRLWFLYRLDPQSFAYNIPMAVHLHGGLARQAFSNALSAVSGRHEVLRSRFCQTAEGPRVTYAAESQGLAALIDLGQCPRDRRESLIPDILRRAIARPFDLEHEPPVRTLLLALAPNHHLLLINTHHIVTDGWSLEIYFRELAHFYRASLWEDTPSLPLLAFQFADYAYHKHELADEDSLRAELAYWQSHLADIPAAIDLPVDLPRPPAQTFTGGVRHLEISREVKDRAMRLCRERNATPFMMLIAAFAELLGRYAGQETLCIGTPSANRNQPGLEHLIGFFVNTLVIRCDLDGDLSFADALDRVRRTALDGFAHQRVSFERVVECLAPKRDLGRSPLFQVMFTLDDMDILGLAQHAKLPGLRLEHQALDEAAALFDLSLHMRQGEEGFDGQIAYNADLFEAETAERMARQFEILLSELTAHPHRPVSRISMIGEPERRWLFKTVAYGALRSGPNIPQRFETRVAQTPGKTALVWNGTEWSYRDLDRAANRLALVLNELGVRQETPVAVCCERTPDMAIALLGILKAGGAYVPLDPAYPRERIGFTLEDARVPVLLTQSSLVPDLPASGAEVVLLDSLSVGRKREGEELETDRIGRVCEGSAAAYYLFTSGSTGRPKGVAISHGSVNAMLAWARKEFGPDQWAVTLAATSICFDLSVYELFLPLTSGGTVALARDALALPDIDAPVTLVNTVPSAMAELLRARGLPLTVNTVNLAGEPLPGVLVRQLYALPQIRKVYNLYGPSEDTTYSTYCVIPREERREPAIGRVLEGSWVYLVDRHLEPVAPGCRGELCLTGAGLARGYLRRPRLTAQKFVPCGFGNSPGERLYRTGDLARYQADGQLAYLGRLDFQVKVRGFRIELGEIESVLRAHPDIREAAVLARSLAGGLADTLVAYLATGKETRPGNEDLRRYLGESLPAFMVPAFFLFLDRLPLTPNGKLDRSALKAMPLPETSDGGRGFVAPSTETERGLASIWSEVLGVSEVGAQHNFFELGGHSLKAVQLASRVSELFCVALAVRTVFDHPNLADQARYIESHRQVSPSRIARPIQHLEAADGNPLSPAQSRLWFLSRLDPKSYAYNLPIAVHLDGRLDRGALAQAYREVIRRHEALRARFVQGSGDPHVVYATEPNDPDALIDLGALPSGLGESVAMEHLHRAVVQPFELQRDPPIRALLIAVGGDRHLLLVNTHHIVTDGWSLRIFFSELCAFYRAFLLDEEPASTPLPFQYSDYARHQLHQLGEPWIQEQLLYWQTHLEGAPGAIELSLDFPRPPAQTFNGRVSHLKIAPSLTAAAERFGRRHGGTLFMVLITAFAEMLSRYAGQDTVCIGTPTANRSNPGLEKLIGFFVNTLVLRCDLDGDPTMAEALGRVRRTALDGFANQDVPFDRVVERLAPERDLSRTPLFQVMFTLENMDILGLSDHGRVPGLEMAHVDLDEVVALFDVSLHLRQSEDGLFGQIIYNTDLFEAETAARMARQYETLLAGLVAQSDLPMSRISMIGEHDRRELLEEPTVTAAVHGSDIVRELEAQVARHPNRRALVWQDSEYSYTTLNRAANRLAAYLAGLGVGPEIAVAVCVERGPEMVAALLAVLKAGGAYVPLDPAYPRERIGFALADTRTPVLLTQASLADGLPLAEARVTLLDEMDLFRDRGPDPNRNRIFDPAQIAYYLYTSGSTGKPKGVAVTHGSAGAMLAWARAEYRPHQYAVTLAATSICFDLSVFELFLPLTGGGTVALAKDILAFNKIQVPVTLVNTVPSAISELLRSKGLPPSVNTVNLAGEPLPGMLVNKLYSLRHVRKVYNLYGPSEDTTYSTFALVPRMDRYEPAIGKPIAGTRAYLLDRNLCLVAPGCRGELCLSGAGLARGYLAQPELTSQRFVPCTFGTRPGARLYRTGDLARIRPDGQLAFLGRFDFQVKVRGFRIELGEIEAALIDYPDVAQAAVLARAVKTGEPVALVAYISTTHGQSVEAEALREFLGRKLPGFMVPAFFVFLERLPLTPNGKLNRGALPLPKVEGQGHAFAAPASDEERALAEIWSEILDVSPIGRHDGFFELGGHSLLATRLVARLQADYEVDFPLKALFANPTIAGIAGFLHQHRGHGTLAPPLVPQPRDNRLAVSFAQVRAGLMQRMAPDSTAYNMPYAFHIHGTLDRLALVRAFEVLHRRHESLRTRFGMVEGENVLLLRQADALAFFIVDFGAALLPDHDRGMLLSRAAALPFSLDTGPLFVVRLLVLGEKAHLLMVNMHHIISDGWSMNVLFAEIEECYRAFSRGSMARLPHLPVQYADFAQWQRQWLEGEVLERQLSYWEEKLRGAPPEIELPKDMARPPVQTFNGMSLKFDLPDDFARVMRGWSAHQGTTPFMNLLAVFAILLRRHCGQEDIVIGTPIANRNRVEVANLIGYFVNMLVLRLDLSRNPRFFDLLAQVRGTALEAFANQDVPFEKLVERIQPVRNTSRSSLFQVAFSLAVVDREQGHFQLANTRIEPEPIDFGTSKFDLSLDLTQRGGHFSGELEYSADIFHETTMKRFVGHFQNLVAALAQNPEWPISRIEIFSRPERQLLVHDLNDTEWDFRKQATIGQVFESQAVRAPDRVALVDGERLVSYACLNTSADGLAQRLANRGVGVGTPVGMGLPQCEGLFVGILATLKAGGYYVPLDRSFPLERLRFMLEDSGIKIVLAEGDFLEDEALDRVLYRNYRWYDGDGAPRPKRAISPDPLNLACLFYTSGSTGRPKGVPITHRNVMRLVFENGYLVPVAKDVFSQASNQSFDAMTFEVWNAFLHGCRLSLVPRELYLNAESLEHHLVSRAVSAMFITTALFNQFSVARPGMFRTLGSLFFGGEAVDVNAVREVMKAGPAHLRHVYGPTECTTYATHFHVDPVSARADTLPIGNAIGNTQVYLAGRDMSLVPLGAGGELLIGGEGLARGYQNRPELTAEKFVPDLFGGLPGGRLYRTGDTSRRNRHGDIEFLGRVDHQVKIRGFRIEPGEVEAVIAAHPQVKETVVLVRTEAGEKQLVAYATLKESGPAEKLTEEAFREALRLYLRESVPPYMVPAHLVFLEAMPLTSNGKIDRAALPGPKAVPVETGPQTGPATGLQRTIKAVWEEYLSLPSVGIHDNFFDLGGHSLMVVKVHTRLQQELGRKIPLVKLFEHTTVASLAKYLEPGEPKEPEPAGEKERASLRKQAMMRKRRKRG